MGRNFPGGHHNVVIELEKVAMKESATKEEMKKQRDAFVKPAE